MAKGKGFQRGAGAGGMGGGMMAQIKRMQEQMAAAQAELEVETTTATVGGGAVKVTMTGAQVCTAIQIDPDMLKDADAEMLQDMILSGINLALEQSRKLSEEKMSSISNTLSSMGLGF